jgi:hypothetical protein
MSDLLRNDQTMGMFGPDQIPYTQEAQLNGLNNGVDNAHHGTMMDRTRLVQSPTHQTKTGREVATYGARGTAPESYRRPLYV